MQNILIYFILYQLAVLHGDQTILREMYAQIKSEVILTCNITKETSKQSWRKNETVLSQGFEMNRSIRGHDRFDIITDQRFYNLKICNITKDDFGTYWCETQQNNSIKAEGTKLIDSDLHGDQTFRREMYAQIESEVILSCNISKVATNQSWRKGFIVLTQGVEINRNVSGHERLEVNSDEQFYNLKIYNITKHDFGTYWCETQQNYSIKAEGTKLIDSGIIVSQLNPYEETSTATSRTNLNADTTTDRQRKSFQSTLRDSSTTETQDDTGMHVGKRLFNGLFVTGFALLCLSICGNCFFDKLRAAFTRKKKRRSDDNKN